MVAGIAIRLWLLPTEGLRGDIDQFVGWVHHIATEGLSTLYEGTDAGPVTFGPVMAYIWALLATIQPAFATVTDASDPAIRALMKLPASLADIGLAALVAYALRDRPRWAAVGAAVVLLGLPAGLFHSPAKNFGDVKIVRFHPGSRLPSAHSDCTMIKKRVLIRRLLCYIKNHRL